MSESVWGSDKERTCLNHFFNCWISSFRRGCGARGVSGCTAVRGPLPAPNPCTAAHGASYMGGLHSPLVCAAENDYHRGDGFEWAQVLDFNHIARMVFDQWESWWSSLCFICITQHCSVAAS